MKRLITILFFASCIFNMIYCQVVEEVDTNTLYKHAYCNIVNDTIITA